MSSRPWTGQKSNLGVPKVFFETIMGVPMIYGVIGLALFAAAYSLYGGLSAVAWTDVIQVVFLDVLELDRTIL